VIGYVDVSPVYLDFGDQSLAESVRAFWTIFIAHWSALWLEGGLLLPVLGLTQCCWFLFNKNEDTALRSLSTLLLFLYIALTVGSSFFFAKRLAIESWSISLRYVFYGNVVALPLFVVSLGSLRQLGFKALFMRLGLCLVVLCFLSIGLFLPESWDKLTNSYAYFHNSPTLDVVYQFRNEGVIPVALALMGASLGSVALAYRYRRAGLVWLLVVLLYIQGASLGYIQHTRDFTIHYCRGKNILAFCDWLEEAEYRRYEVFCEEEYPFLLPNLYYWLNQPSSPFTGDVQKIPRPSLLLTTHAYPEEKLLFMSDDLRAYFLPGHE